MAKNEETETCNFVIEIYGDMKLLLPSPIEEWSKGFDPYVSMEDLES